MRQIITVSLEDNDFRVDEDAYLALRMYLKRAKENLEGNPDQQEILADLEGAIGEKCALLLSPEKLVIQYEEMSQILRDMGPVADGSELGIESEKPAGKPTSRRLTKRPQNAVVDGVCAGLAEYFEIDATVFRVLFVAATLFSGFGIVVYLILVLALPFDTASSQTGSNSVQDALTVIGVSLAVFIGLTLLTRTVMGLWTGNYLYSGSFMGRRFFGEGSRNEIVLILGIGSGMQLASRYFRSILIGTLAILILASGLISLFDFRGFGVLPISQFLLIATVIFIGIVALYRRSASR